MQTNICKTLSMVFKPLLAAIVWEDKAYTQWMTGEGQGFKERQREMVLCPYCGRDWKRGPWWRTAKPITAW